MKFRFSCTWEKNYFVAYLKGGVRTPDSVLGIESSADL